MERVVRPSEQMDDAAAETTQATTPFVAGLERNQATLYSFARRLVGNGEEARDIVQETFADGWRLALRERPPFSSGCGDVDVRALALSCGLRAISLGAPPPRGAAL